MTSHIPHLESSDASVRRQQAALGRQLTGDRRVSGSVGGSRVADSPRFKAKGHDIQLQDAQHGALKVYLRLLDSDPGRYEEGVIVRRDKYTVTFKGEAGPLAGVPRIIYKHAIAELAVIPKAGNLQ